MKILWAALLLPALTAAVELPMKLDELKLKGGKTYTQVTVLSADDIGLRIMHAHGTTRVPFRNLPQDLAKDFDYDPSAALDQHRKEARQQAEWARQADEQAQREKMAELEKKADSRPAPSRPQRRTAGEVPRDRSIEPLTPAEEARILKLQMGISDARDKIASLQQEAQDTRDRMNQAYRTHTTIDAYGNATSRTATSLNKQSYLKKRSDRLEEEARDVLRQIDLAENQIEDIRAEARMRKQFKVKAERE